MYYDAFVSMVVNTFPLPPLSLCLYNRKRGSASYIVREVRERERERVRERERDGSDVTSVALKLAMSFAPFLAKNLHLSFFPLNWR